MTAVRAIATLHEEVRALARERDAVILAHNYQVPEVQDVADYVGDSLGLSRQAAATDAAAIVFCGVHFMAETAAILSPEKTVLIPDLDAGCSLASSITADQLRDVEGRAPRRGRRLLREHDRRGEGRDRLLLHVRQREGRDRGDPAPTARSCSCRTCTSGSGSRSVTGRKLRIWMGECHVHAGIRPADIERWQREAPDAELLVHPECGCASQAMAFANGTHAHPLHRGHGQLRAALAEGPLPRRDRDRDHPPAREGGARQALRAGQREGRLPRT